MNGKIVHLPSDSRRDVEYTADRFPDPGEKVEVLCSLGGSYHVAPFLCSWTDGRWIVVGTDRLLAFQVVGWRRAARGKSQGAASRPQDGRDDRFTELTDTQLAIAALVAEGLLNKQIGHRLGIEVGTVKAHLNKAMSRLGLKNRVQLAVWYVSSAPPQRAESLRLRACAANASATPPNA